jgi:hypothetical protein
LPVYDVSEFDDQQTQFLMKEEDERIIIWEAASIELKIKLWKVLDFEKVFDDQNRLRDLHNERLEHYLDSLNEIKKENQGTYR